MAAKGKPTVPTVGSQRQRGGRHAVDALRGTEPVQATLMSGPPYQARHAAAQPAADGRVARRRGKDDRIREGSRDLGYQAALAQRGPGTSIVGGAGQGALVGASTGATVGSIVPGPGTAVGAAVGAGVGAVAGGAGAAKRKKRERVLRQPWRRALVAEFALCIVITTLAPLTDKRRSQPPQRFMKQAVAVIGLFFVLGLISGIGRGPAKAATGLGGLVALVLVVNERDVFAALARVFGGGHDGSERARNGGD